MLCNRVCQRDIPRGSDEPRAQADFFSPLPAAGLPSDLELSFFSAFLAGLVPGPGVSVLDSDLPLPDSDFSVPDSDFSVVDFGSLAALAGVVELELPRLSVL